MLKSLFFKQQDWPFRGLILLFLIGITPQGGRGQTSNIQHFSALADQCLSQIPESPKKFEIKASGLPSYLLGKAFSRWQQEGRTVFLPLDSTQTESRLPQLSLQLKSQSVQYIPESRVAVTRKLTLVMDMRFIKADGELLLQQVCVQEHQDAFLRKDLGKIETPGFPETASPLPPIPERKWIKPVLISTALGTLGYLLYSVRSGND